MAHYRLVNKLEWMPAIHLKRGMPVPDKGIIIINDIMPWENICTIGLLSLESSDNVEQSVRIWNTLLQFKIHSRLVLPSSPVVFRATDISGKKWIIGSYRRPFPLVTQQDIRPGNPSEGSYVAVRTEWSSPLPLLQEVATE